MSYHIRVVTSDRVIHHFESFDELERWHKQPRAAREIDADPPARRGSRRGMLLKMIDAQPGISSPEMADALDCSADAINHVLRDLVSLAHIEVTGEASHKRRTYCITPKGREALASIITKEKQA